VTRIITEDLEDGSPSWTYSSSPVIVTSPVAHGAKAVRLQGGVSYAGWTFAADKSELYARFYFYRETSASGNGAIADWEQGTSGANYTGRLYLTSATNKLGFLRGSTLVVNGTHDIPVGSYTLIEVYYLIAQTGGRFVVKVNGETDIDYTGDTNNLTNNNFRRFQINKTAFTSPATYYYFDDIAVNDVDGSEDNSWIGAYIETIDVDPDPVNVAIGIDVADLNTYITLHPAELTSGISLASTHISIPGAGRVFGPAVQSG